MIRHTVVILYLTLVASSYLHEDLDGLGARISASVQRDLEPLQNLGARINAEVQEGLRPLKTNNFHNQFNKDRHFTGNGYNDFGSNLASSIQAGLAPLNNLGSQIEETVNLSLQPVKALALVSSMKGGVGGTTIATHSPSGKQFIFEKGNAYWCDGTIISSGQCQGTLEPFSPKTDADYCFIRTSYTIVNNYICIGATSIQVINNEVRCSNYNNTPVLVMKTDDFNTMCKDLSQTVEYKYIADTNNPAHVKIPNENKYVRCNNNEPNVCIFSESTTLGGSKIVTSNTYSSNIVMN